MIRNFIIRSLIALFLFLPAHALAGSFKVMPIKLYLDAQTKTAVIRLTNNGPEKVTVQLEAKEWSQGEAGKDEYGDTKDIVFFPKIFSVEKDEERIIRVGYQGKAGAEEKTYRLYLQELPVTEPGEEIGLKFTLRLGVPIFIAPLKEVYASAIEEAGLSDGMLNVKVNNNGNKHLIVTRIKAVGLDKSDAEVFSSEIGGWYVLHGAIKTFSMDIPPEDCLKASTVQVGVEVKGKKSGMDTRIDVDKARCQRPEEPAEQEKEK